MRQLVNAKSVSALVLAVGLSAACGGDKKKSAEPPSMDTGGGAGVGGSPTGGGAGESGETTTTTDSGGTSSTGGSGGTGGSSEGGAGGEASVAWGEAGFVDIESVTVDMPGIIESIDSSPTTAPTRLFYSYMPNEDPDAPIFAFVGGNVGLSTLALFAHGIGPLTLDPDDPAAAPEENSASWLEMGSLLFIDPRQTGFSYSVLDDPEVDENRIDEYAPLNFNEFVDASSMLRALLRFLADHAEQRDNPVVLVAQGDGGIRTALMLSYLLYPDELRDSEADYVDETLADEVEAHFAAVFPDETLQPELIAQQFGWQVHLQPMIGGVQLIRQADYECLDGSVEQQIADELAVACPPSVRDAWQVEEEADWASGIIADAGSWLSSLTGFETLLGLSPTDVPGMPESERDGAFRWDGRFASESYGVLPFAGDDWNEELGELEWHDRYFISDNTELISGGVYRRNQPAQCAKFLRSIMHVNTFVTNASLDMSIRTPALVDALEACAIVLDAPDFANSPLDSVEADFELDDSVDRPGWLVLNFNDLAEVGAVTRTVRWPEYQASGHAVHWSEPEALKNDVRDFLNDTGL